MTTMKKICTDMEHIMSCGKRLFTKLWNEEDCDYFFQLFFDDAVDNSHSSIELERAVQMFGTNIDIMLTHFDEKEGDSNDPF